MAPVELVRVAKITLLLPSESANAIGSDWMIRLSGVISLIGALQISPGKKVDAAHWLPLLNPRRLK